MAIYDFDDDLRQLGGTRSDAATTCLTRYFLLIRASRKKLRSMFSESELHEIAIATASWTMPPSLEPALRYIGESLPGDVSESCGAKIVALDMVDRVALLDAIQRTKQIKRNLKRDLAGSHLLL